MAVEDELLQAVRESNRWLRILALPGLRERLSAALDSDTKRRIYQHSDGRTIREVATASGAGFGTVQRCWQDWSEAVLMDLTETAGRYRRLLSLAEVGLSVNQ